MSYTLDFVVALGTSRTGLTLGAQLVDSEGDDVGVLVTTGFVELGGGNYLWHAAAIPDGHRGAVQFSEAGTPAVILAAAALNPEEAERADVKTSSVMTAGSGDVAVDHDTGGVDNLRAERGGVGVDEVVIRAYLTADWDAGVHTVRGQAVTGTDGRWIAPMYLDAGAYTFVFAKPGAYVTQAVEEDVA